MTRPSYTPSHTLYIFCLVTVEAEMQMRGEERRGGWMGWDEMAD